MHRFALIRPRPKVVARVRIGARPALIASWPLASAVVVTVALGIPTLIYPYGPDQALFAYIGSHIARGATLYVDVWDVKPPGIFWIFALISAIPGPAFKVLRAFDLLYTCAVVAAIYLYVTGLWGRLAAWSAAVLYGGLYVTATGYWHSAQPDSFMALPLVLGLFAYATGRRTGAYRWSLAAGVLFGLCVQLRPVVVFIPMTLAALDLYTMHHTSEGATRRAAWSRIGLLLVGGAAVELITLLWLGLGGAVGEYLYAQLDFASNYGRQGGPYSPNGLTLSNYLSGLRTGAMFLVFARVLVVVPALAAVVAGGIVRRERAVFEIGLLALAAFFGVAVQGKFFLYHWHLLMPFLAILAGWSVTALWSELRQAGRSVTASGATMLAIAALLLLLTPAVTDRAAREWDGFVRFYIQPSSRSGYYDRFGLYGRGSFSYRASEEVSAYIRRRTEPGDTVFVWGYDPLLFMLAERDSPSRFLSFLPLMATWTPPAWHDEFIDTLEQQRPRYIVTQRGENAPWITGNSIDAVDFIALLPRFQDLLARDYTVETGIEDYTLWRLK